MSFDQKILEKLACPICKGSNFKQSEILQCSNCGATFSQDDGILRMEQATIQNTKKEEVFNFWNSIPNESTYTKEEIHTKEFFIDTEKQRYERHVDLGKPFFKEAIGFTDYTGKQILEIGCGIGADAMQFARAGNEMFLLDLTVNSVKIARERFELENKEAHYLTGDGENLPFKDNSFDMVYSFGVLHHSPNTEKSISEVYRVLKPGGRAIIMLYYKRSANLYCNIYFNQGLRLGKIFKTWSFKKLVSQETELQSQTDNSVNPFTRTFSKKQCRKIFKKFTNLDMQVHYLTPGTLAQFRHLLPLLPKSIKDKLPGLFGWNLIIKADKPKQ